MNWITRNNYTIKRKFNQYNINGERSSTCENCVITQIFV